MQTAALRLYYIQYVCNVMIDFMNFSEKSAYLQFVLIYRLSQLKSPYNSGFDWPCCNIDFFTRNLNLEAYHCVGDKIWKNNFSKFMIPLAFLEKFRC